MISVLVGVGFLVSNLIPFFSTITGFASALCSTIICWTLPYIFALKVGDLTKAESAAVRKSNRPTPWTTHWLVSTQVHDDEGVDPGYNCHRHRGRHRHGHGHDQQDRKLEGRALRLLKRIYPAVHIS